MTRSRDPHRLTILRDAKGFTTAVYTDAPDLNFEITRSQLETPIGIWQWELGPSGGTRYFPIPGEWRLVGHGMLT